MQRAILKALQVRMAVDIHSVQLPQGIYGESDISTREVWVQRNLNPVEEACTTAHEMGHIALGHVRTGNAEIDARMEVEADEWAATELIPELLLSMALTLGRDLREQAEICAVDENLMKARLRVRDRDAAVAQAKVAVQEAAVVDEPRLRIA